MVEESRGTAEILGVARLLEEWGRSLEGPLGGVLGSMPDATVIVDRRGRMLFVNRLTEELFGYSGDELVNSSVEMLVPARLRDAHVHHRATYFADPRVRPMGAGLELWGRRKDGSEFPVEISLSPLHTPVGTVTMSAIRDATERRKAEAERAELVRAHAARAALEEALHAREAFLSVAAHELKTPVTSIRGWAEVLVREMARTGRPEETRLSRAAHHIDEQSRKLAHLVNRLLDLSRVETGQLDVERSEVDLADLVRHIAATFESEGLTLRVVGPPTLYARVDPLRIEQVLTNLLDNAMKYGAPGGPVTVELDVHEGTAILTVSDTGPGIENRHRAHIFEPFYRADPPSGVPGVGLGLYLSRRIVEQHGGSLGAEHPASGGTRMIARLPLAPPERAGGSSQ